MTSRPHLVYPAVGTALVGHAPASPHAEPTPHPASPPITDSTCGDTAIAPFVTYADPDPAAATAATATGGFAQGRLRRGAAAWPLAAAAAVALVVLALAHHGGPGLAGPRPVQAGAAAGAVGGASRAEMTHRLGPITLPRPLGEAKRTVPLETIWVIDRDLPRSDLATISREVPVDVAYLADYSLPRDQLGFALLPGIFLRVQADEASLARTAAQPWRILTAEPQHRIRLPRPTPGHDLALVVLTARPAAWLRAVPAGPIPPTAFAGSRPGEIRTYLIDLRPGSAALSDLLRQGSTQPQLLSADPGGRGSVARALARAFVDAIGAIWPS